jgi:hypothetical protein
MLDIKLGILPMPPLLGVDRQAHGDELLPCQQRDQSIDRFDYCGHRRILRRKRKQSALNVTVGRYSLKRRGGKFRPGSK